MKKSLTVICILALGFVATVSSLKNSRADERSAIATYTCNKLSRFLENEGKMLDTQKLADEKNIEFAEELFEIKGCK